MLATRSTQDLIDRAVVLQLVLDPHRFRERQVHAFLDLPIEVVADLLLGDLDLFLAGLLGQGVDRRDDFLDGRVRRFERADDLLFGDLFRAGLDHHDRVIRARDDEIEPRFFALLVRRIDDVVAADQADADARVGLREGNRREGERRGRAGNCQDVGVVLGVCGQQQGDDLSLVAPTGGEERSRRPVDQPAGEDLFFARFAFPLEEAARDSSRGIGVFAVVDGQGQEVDPLSRVCRRAGGDEDHGIAAADDDGAVSLLGEAPGLDRDRSAAH